MMEQVNQAIKKSFSNVKSSFMGLITSVIPDKGKVHAKAGADNEARDIFIITPYGYFSMPDKDLDSQVIFNNNARRVCMVGVDNFPIKPVDLKVNEVVIFNKESKAYIYMKNDGTVLLKTPGNVVVESGGDINATASGNVNIKGSVINLN